jgi:hypothetical protein
MTSNKFLFPIMKTLAVAAACDLLPAQVTKARQVVFHPQLELVLGMRGVGYAWLCRVAVKEDCCSLG